MPVSLSGAAGSIPAPASTKNNEVTTMIQFLISAAFVLLFLFVFVLLASGMFWVVVRVLRSLFPERFKPGRKREKDEV